MGQTAQGREKLKTGGATKVDEWSLRTWTPQITQ